MKHVLTIRSPVLTIFFSAMLKVRLPESIMEGEAMKALWKETVVICFILNDIYSVQKEIVSLSYHAHLRHADALTA